MIRKLISLFLLVITVFSFSNLNTVKAEGVDIVWSIVNTHMTYYILFGQVDVPVASDTVLFYLPETIYSSVNIGGGTDSKLEFYEEDGTHIIDLDWYDTFGDQIAGNFDLDFSEVGIVVNEPIYMKLSINQTFEVAPASTYVDYVEANATMEFLYSNPDYRDYYFVRDETVTYKTIEAVDIIIPYQTYSIVIDMRDVSDYYIKYGVYSSYISLFNSSDVMIEILYLYDYMYMDSDYIIIGLPFDTYDINDAQHLKIKLIVDFNNMDDLDDYNRNFKIDFNKNINLVYFMSQTTLLSTSVLMDYGGIPTAPADPTPPTGFEFTGWFLADGDIYNFTHISSDMFIDNSLSLYAYYRVSGAASDYGVTDAIPDTGTNIFNVLSAFGFDTDVGFIFIYLGLILIASITLVYFHISGFVVLVIDLMITALFMYLGFLPLYVIALVFVALVLGLLFYMGGVNSE